MAFSFAFCAVAEWNPAAVGSPRTVLEHVYLDQARQNNWEVVKAFVLENAVCVNAQPAARFSALHQAAEARMRFVCACVRVSVGVCVCVCTCHVCVCGPVCVCLHLLCASRPWVPCSGNHLHEAFAMQISSALLHHRPAMCRWFLGCWSRAPTQTARTKLVSGLWTALPHARFMCVCVCCIALKGRGGRDIVLQAHSHQPTFQQ